MPDNNDQGLLDDDSAYEQIANKGANNGYASLDSSGKLNEPIKSSYTDVISSRDLDTVYQNTSGKPMLVCVTVDVEDPVITDYCGAIANIGASNPPTTLVQEVYFQGVTMTDVLIPMSFIVPDQYYYQIASNVHGSASVVKMHWVEALLS